MDVLFKAKRIDNSQFVEGYFWGRKNSLGEIIESVIICDAYEQVQYGRKFLSSDFGKECFRVDPSTLSPFTGVTDIRGVKIFERDRVIVPMYRTYSTAPKLMKGTVEWENGAYHVTWDDNNYGRSFLGYLDGVEVIAEKIN